MYAITEKPSNCTKEVVEVDIVRKNANNTYEIVYDAVGDVVGSERVLESVDFIYKKKASAERDAKKHNDSVMRNALIRLALLEKKV